MTIEIELTEEGLWVYTPDQTLYASEFDIYEDEDITELKIRRALDEVRVKLIEDRDGI